MTNSKFTPADYLSSMRFPLTSQEDLSLTEQRQIDAFNLDQLHEAVANGYQMDDEQKGILVKLETKTQHAPEVIEQAQAQGLM